MSENTFLVVTADGKGATSIEQVESRDTLNILQCTGQPPAAKNRLSQNISSAKVVKIWIVEIAYNLQGQSGCCSELWVDCLLEMWPRHVT